MNEETIEKMKNMKLFGMLRAFDTLNDSNNTDNLSSDEHLAFLIDAEWDDRYNRKLNRLLKAAKFRYKSAIEQVNFKESRNLNKSKFLRLANCDWIKKNESIIITGPTGVGKSYLACSLGHRACTNSYKVLYFNCMKLFSKLKFSKADGTYEKEINKIKNQNLIILDDFGLHVLDAVSRLILLEIFEDRHGLQSTIMTSQLPTSRWHAVIGDQTIADAICDRIVHNSHKINLKGDSLRKKGK
jgi:DNA replication protein DnaC